MKNQNKKIKYFKIRDFEVQMYDKSIIVATFLLLLISLLATIFLHNTSNLTLLDPVLAQLKGGLSTSSVNPNSTIGERTGNTTGDLNTGGTSAASVTDGLAMTMSSSGKTGNTTNLTLTEGGVSASSVNEAGEK
ncbi:MAG: hypothetical protein M3297_01835 [Thermoproteota archaeon]|nr:hypothetical protein [Thermoproteota archaeon]